MWPAERVRLDMLTVISFLSSRVQAPTEQDWEKLNRLLKYLNKTADLALTLNPDEGLTVHGYADASFGVHADGKSHTGAVITIGKGAIYGKSSKQKIVTKSSTEAELVGATDSASQLLHVSHFMEAQGHPVEPVVFHQDNQSTITLVKKGRSTNERTRHIHVRYFFLTDKIRSGEIKIEYTPTEEMLADILTKPLQGELFRKMRSELLGLN